MKHFLLFVYDARYPLGGWYDFRGSFDTLEEAIARASTNDYGNKDIIDSLQYDSKDKEGRFVWKSW